MEDDYLVHYGVLGMKWGVRKTVRKSGKSAYASRRSEYNRWMADKSAEKGLSKQASKYRKKANKYQKKSQEYYRQAEKEADKIFNKSYSEKNPNKRRKLGAYGTSEAYKRETSKLRYHKINSKNLDMAFKEAKQRSDNKRLAISSAIGAGAAIVTTLMTGGFLATPAVSVASTQAAKIGMQHFTNIDGQTVLVTAAGEIIKK